MTSVSEEASPDITEVMRRRIEALESAVGARDAELAALKGERARLERAYELLKEELALLKRRLFVATAERVDTRQLQLEFETLLRSVNAMARTLDAPSEEPSTPGGESKPKPRKPAPKGRRDMAESDLPVVPVEIEDELFEKLVAEGKAERIGAETSYKLARERGGLRRLEIRRITYRAINSRGNTELETAPVPKELLPRCLAAPSVLAHILSAKYCDGLPLYRIEQIYEREGFGIDRGTMSRWIYELGTNFGGSLIAAFRAHAMATAFCIATDATGFAIQPSPSEDNKRRPCRKGHYFALLADRDYVFFEFKPQETSAAVRAMFRGYEGYVQADAKSVYDVLYRPPESDSEDDDGCSRREVGCWAHARRKFWEAALAKEAVAREALVRIGRIFELDATYRKHPPSKTKTLRQEFLRPHVEDFLAFAEAEYEKVRNRRGSLRSALGYCVRQKDALQAFLDDGRLRMDNNLAENALRKVVIIRDSALFAGSDEHAEAAGHVLSLIATARLHGLDPVDYLRDLIRVLPFWPRARYLELSPLNWPRTRQRIEQARLLAEVGDIEVPPLSPL